MSLEKALREMVRRELAQQLAPLRVAVGRMEKGLDAVESLREITERLEPLADRLGAMVGMRQVLPETVRVAQRAKAPAAKAPEAGEGRACAVKGCERPSRSKGYCSAHYQKLRLLIKTGRRPADWVDGAEPQSVEDVKLPRGRAAAQAREAAPPPEPVPPPTPKAWVRKKGNPEGLVSLHGS